MWSLEFTDTALKQMSKIDPSHQKRIFNYLGTRVAILKDPRTLGKPLKGELQQFWRFRVGDYRVIVDILDQRLVIQILQVGHRREIYN